MTDPMSALLQDNNARIQAVEQLAQAHNELLEAIEKYREAWRQARDIGWATTDLTRRGGLTNPAKLPRPKRTAPADESSTTNKRASADPLD